VTASRRAIIVAVLFATGVAISVALEWAASTSGGGDDERETETGPARPQRIIATAPSTVETLFALGASDRVVGVGDWCTYPPEAGGKPRIGGEHNPNFERILALQPDLVIAQGRAEKLDAFCRRNGIGILHVNTDRLATLKSGLREIGRAIGMAPAAERLLARIELDLAAVAYRVAGRPRPKVFLCMSHRAGSLRGLSSASGATLLGQLLTIAGGANIFAEVERHYPPISKEALLQRAPEVILELHPGEALSDEARQQLLSDWQAMASLPAVRHERIHILTDDDLMIPGPRVPRVAERLAKLLHPSAEATDGR